MIVYLSWSNRNVLDLIYIIESHQFHICAIDYVYILQDMKEINSSLKQIQHQLDEARNPEQVIIEGDKKDKHARIFIAKNFTSSL